MTTFMYKKRRENKKKTSKNIKHVTRIKNVKTFFYICGYEHQQVNRIQRFNYVL